MAIPTEVREAYAVGNGNFNEIDFDFRIWSEDELLVTVVDADGNETTLELGVDYEVSGIDEADGGTVTLLDDGQDWLDAEGDLDSGWEASILGLMPITQETDIRNEGEFLKEVIETQFDKCIAIDQQQQNQIDRSLKLPPSEEWSSGATTVPTIPQRANKYPFWDADGKLTAVANVDAGSLNISAFMEAMMPALDAAEVFDYLGIDAFVQTLFDDADAGDFFTTLGVTPYIQTLLDDVNANTARGTLGFNGTAGGLTITGGLNTGDDFTIIAGAAAASGTDLILKTTSALERLRILGSTGAILINTASSISSNLAKVEIDNATNGVVNLYLRSSGTGRPLSAYISSTTSTEYVGSFRSDNNADVTLTQVLVHRQLNTVGTQGGINFTALDSLNNAPAYARILYEIVNNVSGGSGEAGNGAILLQSAGGNFPFNWHTVFYGDGTQIILNKGGEDFNTFIRSLGDDNCFVVDGGTDMIGIGTSSPAAKLDLFGSFATRADTPSQITGDQNNYPVNYAFVRLDTSGAHTITGFSGGVNGRRVVIANVGSNNLIIAHQGGTSSAANRVITGTGADLTVAADETVEMIYDATASRWRIIKD